MFPLPWHPGPLAAKLRPGLAALFALRLASRFAACKPGQQKKDLGTQREKAWPKTRDSTKKAVQEQMPRAENSSKARIRSHAPEDASAKDEAFPRTYLATLYKSVEVWRVLLAPAKTTRQSENSVLRNTRPSANRFACMPAFLHQEAC